MATMAEHVDRRAWTIAKGNEYLHKVKYRLRAYGF